MNGEPKEQPVSIGIDVGIASVGWCIMNNTDLSIIKHGVRLFNTVDDPQTSKLLNAARREKRSYRRQINRKKTLKRDFVKWLIEGKYIKGIKIDDTSSFMQKFRETYLNEVNSGKTSNLNDNSLWIYELRLKALREKIPFDQLITILYWYLSHRGFKYEIKQDDEINKNSTENDFAELRKKSDYPAEMQINYYRQYGKIRGDFNRNFRNEDYRKELEAIFSNQNVSSNFIEGFFCFFGRQRSFSDGPGNLHSITPWGRRYIDEKTGCVKENATIWEKTISSCKYHPNNKCMLKQSLTAEIFNLLNDLNNLKIGESQAKLSYEDKQNILKKSFEVKSNFRSVEKYIKSHYQSDVISGYRVNAKRKEIITSLEAFHKIKKFLKVSIWDYFTDDFQIKKNNLFDIIFEHFSKNYDLEERWQFLKKEYKNLFNEGLNYEFFKKNSDNFTKYHAFCKQCLWGEFIPTMLREPLNQMQIQENSNSLVLPFKVNHNKHHINLDWVDKLIASPTVKRSLIQTVHIINSIIDFCREHKLTISNIALEMTRTSNNKQEREKIQFIQKINKERKDRIREILWAKNISDQKWTALNTKIYLWLEQNCKDAYTGQDISIDEIIKYRNKFDIDHIIPRSISFDNSWNNKVLTVSTENHKKNKLTGWQYVNTKSTKEKNFITELWYQWYLKSSNKNITKYLHLTDSKDYSDPDNQAEFINRNLNDTSYIARETLLALKTLFKDKNAKILTINGKMTSFARKMMNAASEEKLKRPEGLDQYDPKTNKKNREWHGHHAEDAYLVAVLAKNYKAQKTIEKYNIRLQHSGNKDIGSKWFKYYKLKEDLKNAKTILNSQIDLMKYSRRVVKKSNKQFFNETLYRGIIDKASNNVYGISKIDLLNAKKSTLEKYFSSKNAKDASDLLIYHNEYSLYKTIQDVYQNHIGDEFPFRAYKTNDKLPRLIFYHNKQQRVVESLKVKTKSILRRENLIFASKEHNKNSFYTVLNWISIAIFKNQMGKYIALPINSSNAQFGINSKQGFAIGYTNLQRNNWELQKKKNDILTESTPICFLYKGSILRRRDDGSLWYVNGAGGRSNTNIEIKPVSFKLNERKFLPLNKSSRNNNNSIENYDLIIQDCLGETKAVVRKFE